MGDPPQAAVDAKPKPPWVAAFVTRLCLIAWSAAILTELLPPGVIESSCILVGSQAAILGILTCLFVGLQSRQGLFLVLLVAIAAPGVYFAVVVRQVAQLNGWMP